MDENKKAVW